VLLANAVPPLIVPVIVPVVGVRLDVHLQHSVVQEWASLPSRRMRLAAVAMST
jgi:hypothetical protein